ncbi:MAG: hypothetical protein EBZ59_06030 [Planctomycetia bacterium]|nr:hypothetical protein [Planctomycetia bacterium]
MLNPPATCAAVGRRLFRLAACCLMAVGGCGFLAAEEPLPIDDEPVPVGEGTVVDEDWCRRDARRYAVFDAVFLQPGNAAVNRPIVVDAGAPNVPVLTSRGPTSVVGTGFRVLYGSYGDDDVGWEAGYLAVYGMQGVDDAKSVGGSLQAAGDLGLDPLSPLRNASLARVTEHATVSSAEVNLVDHCFDGGYAPLSGRPWQRCRGYGGGHVDWLAGFRWAGLDDSATLGFNASAPVASTYTSRTTSNLFAAQAGARGRMAWDQWAFEGWMKVGLAGTSISGAQSTFDALTGAPFRPASSAWTGGMGMIADMNLSAVYRLNETWGLRAGYNLIWLTGVALAADQWNFAAVNGPAAGLNHTGSLFLGGGSLGLEARW